MNNHTLQLGGAITLGGAIGRKDVTGERRDVTIDKRELFHRLWTKAVGTKDYNKKEWLAMERVLGL